MRRTILVTGASSGIGAQLAREFAARGRDLALCARRVDRLDQLRDELLASHPGLRVVVRPLDVTEPEDVRRVFGEVRDEFGSLDRVIVNAGSGSGRPIGSGIPETNLGSVRTNVVGLLAQCEAATEVFRGQGTGHLVVVSSVSAVRGMPGSVTAYAAGKAFGAALAEGLRIDLAGSPIVVTTILPGYIRTDMTAGLGRVPFMATLERGTRALVAAIEREPATAVVPWWPWAPFSVAIRLLPRTAVRRMT
jgi:short-subunit dehydrogenase